MNKKMASRRLHIKKMAMRRKLHTLRSLSSSHSVRKSSIIKDALVHIYKLKRKLEAIKRELSFLLAIKDEYLTLVQPPKKEVKVEKAGKGFVIRVRCDNKRGDELVSILEVFEEMGLNVLHSNVSCSHYFSMEAIVVGERSYEVKHISQAILDVLDW